MNEMSMVLMLFLVLLPLASAQYYCADGYDCLSRQICTGAPVECTAGLYCPGGDVNTADLCPPGTYCPTPNVSIICPKGSVCHSAHLEPKKCLGGSACKEGSYKQRWFLLILLEALLVVFVVVGVTVHKLRVKKRTKRTLQEQGSEIGLVQLPKNVMHELRMSINMGVEETQDDTPDSGNAGPVLRVDSEPDVGSLTDTRDDPKRNIKFNLKFEDIGLTITKNKQTKTVLTNVSGEFRHSEVSLIMGPSGAGKTSLMKILCGKSEQTSGVLKINGKEEKMSKFKKLVGYVPQEDVMLRKLSVREVLMTSAFLRLPMKWSYRKKVELVGTVIRLLKLESIQDSVIGDESQRGISGGERKRVNIGIELVANPRILFLDEPTTGLDASSSQEVMSYLKAIARRGISVIAVIHQPRYEILEISDKLLMLGKGGKTVYMGPTKTSVDYFSHIGFPCPEYFNPADHFMDVVSGKVNRHSETSKNENKNTLEMNEEEDGTAVTFDVSELPTLWKENQDFVQQNSTTEPADDFDLPPRKQKTMFQKAFHSTTRFLHQTGVQLVRCFHEQVRDLSGLTWELGYQILPGAAMGITAMNREVFIPPVPSEIVELCPLIIRDRCENEAIQGFITPIQTFFICMAVGAASAIGANVTFMQKANYYRESGSGINALSYFVAKNIFDFWHIIRNTLTFVALYGVLGDPPGSYGWWFLSVLLLNFCAYGMAYTVSWLAPNLDAAIVISVVSAVAWSVTSGLSPKLPQVNDTPPLQVLWWISYARWAAESMYIIMVSEWPFLRVRANTEYQGYDKDNYGMDIGMLILIGVVWRILAYAAMRLRNRKKQM